MTENGNSMVMPVAPFYGGGYNSGGWPEMGYSGRYSEMMPPYYGR